MVVDEEEDGMICNISNIRIVAWSRLRHNVRRPGQIVFPDSDSVCPNGDKIYLTIVTFRFLLLINEKRDLISPFRFEDCPLLASRRDAESKRPRV